jgi:hypothetical protein
MTSSGNGQGWALVTGASAGIGEAFARELARRGWNLVLTARRLDRLATLAGELTGQCGVRCVTIVADLADPGAPAAIFAATRSQGLDIDLLVNNAGYGVPGRFHEADWPTHRAFLEVLMVAPAALTHLYLPGMRERRRGRIANIASLAGWMPGSIGATLYAASKSYLIKFSQSLALENRPVGVTCTAVCPGFTYSEFHDVTGSRELVSKMPRAVWMSSAEVARIGVDATLAGEVVCVTGRVNRLLKFFGKHVPDRLGLWLMERRSRDFRKLSD